MLKLEYKLITGQITGKQTYLSNAYTVAMANKKKYRQWTGNANGV